MSWHRFSHRHIVSGSATNLRFVRAEHPATIGCGDRRGAQYPGPMASAITIETERAALDEAREAADQKLTKLASLTNYAADDYTAEFMSVVIAQTMEQLRRDLVVFGRIDDDRPWRIGLYGIDRDNDQLVVDWRARFAEAFYQATFDNPSGLTRRVSYVGCIDDLMVEEFETGQVSGTSPLMAELSRSRGPQMRTAVATLQAEQDRLVRRDPDSRLVLRGGPGTGKTVVGLHRAAWLTYNDRRVTSDRILILGPSDRFLRFIATVLPTLGEHRINQTTIARHFGAPATQIGSDEAWLDILDRFEASLLHARDIRIRGRTVPEEEIAEALKRFRSSPLPWRDRRRAVIDRFMNRFDATRPEIERAFKDVLPAMSTAAAWKKLRSAATLRSLGVDEGFIARWRAVDDDGPLHDEVRARFEGVPVRFSHAIVDEAQDLSIFGLRAVQRRAKGLTLVGDDAQRSAPNAIGLERAAQLLGSELEEMTTAYRMSAEIAEWLNHHAQRHDLPAVRLVGVRPIGLNVATTGEQPSAAAARLAREWSHVAVINHDDVWDHKGVEYDAVVVDTTEMSPAEIYLAASRAAHQLVIAGQL